MKCTYFLERPGESRRAVVGAGVRAALQPPHLCRDCFPAAPERRVAAVLRPADAPPQHQRGDHPPQEQQVRPQTQLRDECVGH